MKSFPKTVLAVMCGILVMNILGILIFFMIFGAFLSAGDTAPVLPRSGVLRMDMSAMTVVERPSAESEFQSLFGGSVSQVGLWELVQSIDAAAADPSVSYIYLKPEGGSTSVAHLEEIRKALSRFRESGKPVISFIENPDTRSYYLASVADKVYMSSNSGATPMIVGVGTQLFFLKDLLDKLGVNVQLIRHGKYKSAGEMYVRSSASAENLEQNQAMVNSIWNSLADEICESRGMDVATLSGLIDNLSLNDASDMLEYDLVDSVLDRNELREKLAALAMVPSFKELSFIPIQDYVKVKGVQNIAAKDQIAVVYADGEIVDGSGTGNVAGDLFASEIAKIREDESVKAVVLRVSSPGGSVVASDKIRTELELLAGSKPLIASYGDYAASGGYWISAGCDRIFSDRTTLTGSIGCFSMIPDFSATADKVLHIGVTTVGSSRHTGMYSGMGPLDREETAYMQKSVENIYDRFISVVAEGRNLEEDYVDSIGQGRVWTGADALGINLVDETGTLRDAVIYAAMCASDGDPDLSKWNIQAYPKPLSLMESLMESFGSGSDALNDVFEGTAFENFARAFSGWSHDKSEHFYARMPYGIVIR